MTKEFKKHPVDYVLLIFTLSAFLVAFLFSMQDLQYQFLLSLGLGIAYVTWGVLHHYHTHTLRLRIVLEYFFIGTLATSILMLVNLR